jgi:hypothetical protein
MMMRYVVIYEIFIIIMYVPHVLATFIFLQENVGFAEKAGAPGDARYRAPADDGVQSHDSRPS